MSKLLIRDVKQNLLADNEINLMSEGPGSINTGSPQESLMNNTGVVQVVQQTVKFDEDGTIVPPEVQSAAATADLLFSGTTDGLENSLKDFLKRPVIIREGTWSSSQAVFADLFPISPNFPNDWFAKPMIKNKLIGFRYFRGTLVLRLQVNGQPFNAGRLMMFFNPLNKGESTNPSNLIHFGGVSGYRHVDLDLGVSTATTFRIPFMSPLTHIDLIDGAGHMGTVRIKVYSKLTGSAAVEFALWAHYEDISLEMPTGLPIFNYTPSALSRFAIQAKGELQEEKQMGDVENLFRAQSRITARLGDIPVIGAFADGATWFLDALAGVSGIFGFSKPTDPEFATAIEPKYNRNMANYNGKSLAKPLGLDARNSTSLPQNYFGTNDDEMSLAHLLQKHIYTDRFTMDSTNTPSTRIWSWPVHPMSCIKTTATDVTTHNNTMLSYLGTLFSFWRGGLCYFFKIVKTPFHSGRIRITFVPGAVIGTALTDVDRDYCYSKIVDIRDTTEFSFSIPFVSNQIWNTMYQVTSGIAPSATTYERPTGMLFVEVLNTLVNPTTAANSIEFIVESCADEDFQYAFVTRKTELEVVPAVEGVEPERFSIQMKGVEPFFEMNNIQDQTPNLLAMGEVITSLRQVLKRYTRISNTPIPANTAGHINKIWPYITKEGASKLDDMYSYIEQVFRMYTGSMRVMFALDKGLSTGVTKIALSTWDIGDTTLSNDYFYASNSDDLGFTDSRPNVLFYGGFENIIELDVPFYQNYPALPTAVGKMVYASDLPGSTLSPNLTPFNTGSVIFMDNPDPLFMYRMIGEDFRFGYSLGPPITTFTQTP